MILGAVLAGGQSTRFGSDKALAVLDGETLLLRAVDQLSGWCDKVVVVGRSEAPAPTLPDWPAPQMGPLAGIAAALHHANEERFEAVLTCGVDSVDLPEDLPARLSPGPAFVEDQPVIGLWPKETSSALDVLLESDGRHSLRAFAEAVNARGITLPRPTLNINTPADLASAEKHHGL